MMCRATLHFTAPSRPPPLACLLAVEEGEALIKKAKLPADDELVISYGELRGELEQLIEAGGSSKEVQLASKE